MNNDEILKELLETSRKNAKYQKRTMQIMFGIFLVVLISTVILLPKVISLVSSAHGIMTRAETSIEQIDEMTASITETSRGLNDMVSQNAVPLADSMNKLQRIDFDGLNQAISDLQAAVGPFAKFMKAF